MRKNNDEHFGQPAVAIVGAGPGDPDLLTMKAHRYIKGCDVLMYDGLFGDDIMQLVPDYVEKVYVGKTYGDHQDQTERQKRINNIFLENWKAGKKTVRLKTGDPLIFSRGIEEIRFLNENGIPFEIVPGITSSLAGASSLGISLTERFSSSAVVFTTGFLAKNVIFPIHLYFEFLKDGGCLVVYMGLKLLGETCRKLKEEGFGEEMKIIVAGNISKPNEEIFKGHVGTICSVAANANPPAIVYIGKNVYCHIQ